MARPIPYQNSADALMKPAKNATFFDGWEPERDNLNHPLLCAELSRLAYAQPDQLAAPLASIGFAEVHAFEHLGTSTEGFVSHHREQGLTVLAFRGTQSDDFADLICDGDTLQAGYTRGSRIHSGFKRAYLTIRDQLPPLLEAREATLLITGHSLGAALATVAALDFPPSKLITFGSPRVGDATFCARFADLSVLRFVNCCDVIPRVPPERFVASYFAELFAELGNFTALPPLGRAAAEAAAKLIAVSLSLPFASNEGSNRFQHIAPAHHIRANGSLAEATGSDVADQNRARSEYRGGVRIEDILTLFRPLPPDQGPLVRTFIDRVFALTGNAPVLLRDLADHAPINYVSAFAGRR